MKKTTLAGFIAFIAFSTTSEALVYYVESNNNYILPISSALKLSKEDISHLSLSEARIARNEIYAKHGSIFYVDDMNSYFRSKSWYEPLPQGIELDTNLLSDIEKENIQLIVAYERAGIEPKPTDKTDDPIPSFEIINNNFTDKIIGFDVLSFMSQTFDNLDAMLNFLAKYEFKLIESDDFTLTLQDNIETDLTLKLDYDGSYVSAENFHANVTNYIVNLSDAKAKHFDEYQKDLNFIYCSFEDGVYVDYYFTIDSLQTYNPKSKHITITKNKYN
ncbi:MAG: hypothetical protein ATN31_10565 [Candidatus Epulonipiscioides saccharophilum]|nr:MAG: hypothetical protein ATN31_10565 [Epulopiscium sp. AS2M-Bin001]